MAKQSADNDITYLHEKVSENARALARIEAALVTVTDRPVDEVIPRGRHPFQRYNYPPQLCNKAGLILFQNETLTYVPQPEHLPTALSTLQHDINALAARMDGIHADLYRMSLEVAEIKTRIRAAAATVPNTGHAMKRSSTEEEPKKKRSRKK